MARGFLCLSSTTTTISPGSISGSASTIPGDITSAPFTTNFTAPESTTTNFLLGDRRSAPRTVKNGSPSKDMRSGLSFTKIKSNSASVSAISREAPVKREGSSIKGPMAFIIFLDSLPLR